jgi:hypothetical protein
MVVTSLDGLMNFVNLDKVFHVLSKPNGTKVDSYVLTFSVSKEDAIVVPVSADEYARIFTELANRGN